MLHVLLLETKITVLLLDFKIELHTSSKSFPAFKSSDS